MNYNYSSFFPRDATIVSKAWDKKITSVPSSMESSSANSQDLDIPSFLRKNKGTK